jgi:hypothetical protein
LERVEKIAAFGLWRVDLSRVPETRLVNLARYGLISKAQVIEGASLGCLELFAEVGRLN